MKRRGCLSGNKLKYVYYMHQRYGLTFEEIEQLDNLRFKEADLTIEECQRLIAKYQDALVGLDIRDERMANEEKCTGHR